MMGMRNSRLIMTLATIAVAVVAGLLPRYSEAVFGHVYSRAYVVSESGNKYWAEYNTETGDLEGQPFEATGNLAEDEVVLMSAVVYNNYLEILDSITQQFEDLHNDPNSSAPVPEVVSRSDLETMQFETLVQPAQSISNPESLLYESTTHVVLRPPVQKDGNIWRYASSDNTQLVLAQMPIDPEAGGGSPLGDNVTSLLIDRKDGNIVRQSENNIGFYTNYFGEVNQYDPTGDDWHRWLRQREDKIWGPIPDVAMSMMVMSGADNYASTDQEGKYFIPNGPGPACSVLTDLSTGVVAQLWSKNFNPRSFNGRYPYFVRKPYYIPCDPTHPANFGGSFGGASIGAAAAYVSAQAAAVSTAYPAFGSVDFIIDMMVLSGKATVKNEVVGVDALDPFDPKEIRTINIAGDQAGTSWNSEVEITGSSETKYQTTDFQFDDPNGDTASDEVKRTRQQSYDFDGDGTPDATIRVHYVCVQINEQTGEETLIGNADQNTTCGNDLTKKATYENAESRPEAQQYQGVYLSSVHGGGIAPDPKTPPDLVRQLDYKHNNYHEGLLKSLSLEDLRNTDIYVFRESTGQLVAERSGLAKEEVERHIKNIGAEIDEDNPDAKPFFFYRTQLRGSQEGKFRISGEFSQRHPEGLQETLDERFTRWQISSGMNPAFHEREADHIRAGEPLRIVAINRATGYIGSVKTAAQHGGSDSRLQNLSWIIPDIVMGPPNLKVWAERDYNVAEGLTEGEERSYLIGNEGGAMSDDITIRIYTEWYDQDGTALPDDMDEFGLTGRIGKLTADNTVTASGISSEDESGDALAQFPIKPGRHIQLIRVSESGVGSNHLYIQINGEPYIRSPNFSGTPEIDIERNQERDDDAPDGPDFDTLGAGEGHLQYRPKHYAPFLVPTWDEKATLEAQMGFNALIHQARQQAIASGGTFDKATYMQQNNIIEPSPVYSWRYRPEFQFSVYELAVSAIERHPSSDPLANSQNFEIFDLLNADNKIISTADYLVKFLYSLTNQVAEPLPLFSSEMKELILAVGEEEIRLTLEPNKTIEIENLEHFAYLDFDDFLTMRIFLNNDSENILWEWAFGAFEVYPNPLPLDGVTRTRIRIGAKSDNIPMIDNPQDMPEITFNGDDCDEVRQDEYDTNVFYCTPPEGSNTQEGAIDVVVNGLDVPSVSSFAGNSVLRFEHAAEYTDQAELGVENFSEGIGVSIEEASSMSKWKQENEGLSGNQAAEVFMNQMDSQVSIGMYQMSTFLEDKTVAGEISERLDSLVTTNNQRTQKALSALGASFVGGGGGSGGTATGINILAMEQIANEQTQEPLAFLISRPIVNSSQLEVLLKIEGSAIYGDDYTLITSTAELPVVAEEDGELHFSVLIPSNEEDVILYAVPNNDNVAEIDESVTFVILPNSSYTIGVFDQAIGQIQDGNSLVFSSVPVFKMYPTYEEINNISSRSSLWPMALAGSTPSLPYPIPKLGTANFFNDVKTWMGATGKNAYVGANGNSSYVVLNSEDINLSTHTHATAGKTIANAIASNPDALAIINGALFNYKNKEPLVTTGVVFRNKSVQPTSTNAGKDSYKVAKLRYWFGQDRGVADNNQALSFQFGGKGNPPALDAAIGGLISVIWPDSGGNPTKTNKSMDADLAVYSGMMGPLYGHGMIGVDRDSGMIIFLSKENKAYQSFFSNQNLLFSSGIDQALGTDGGSSVALYASGKVLIEGGRHNSPDEDNTVTSYFVVAPK